MNLPLKPSKIVLSEAEYGLASQPNMILTKNRIIDAVYEMFGHLAIQYQHHSDGLCSIVPAATGILPKISRGEKYEDMPWVMLDYPRLFSSNGDHFAIRTLFWWGHFFSIQWHAAGQYAHSFRGALPHLLRQGWYTGFTADAWNHALPNEQWQPTDSFVSVPPDFPFLKAAKKIPIERWETVPIFLEEAFKELVLAITNPH